jgi:hypothetical protein
MRQFFSFIFLLACLLSSASAQTYKCKDKSGNWTESACPDYEQRMQKKGQQILEERARKNWVPQIGMRSTEVEAMLKSPDCRSTSAFKWCGYWKVNTTKTAGGTREQWVFSSVNGLPLHFLYFENGILVAIQE